MTPIISLTDYNTLRKFIQRTYSNANAKEMMLLSAELNKAEVVKDELAEGRVGLYSIVEFEDLKQKKRTGMQLVLPESADLANKKISILAPISIALLGFKAGDTIEWSMPAGVKNIKILQVNREVEVES